MTSELVQYAGQWIVVAARTNRAPGARVDRTGFLLVPGNSWLFTACLLWLLAGCGDNGPAGPGDAAPVTDNVVVAATDIYDGRTLFELHCSACHDRGPGHPGTMRLQERIGEEQAALLDRDNLPAEYIKLVVREGFKLMPPFRPSELTERQLEELADYISGSTNR